MIYSKGTEAGDTRRTYTEIVDDISSTILAYSEETQLPMGLPSVLIRDFHIQLQLAPGTTEVLSLHSSFKDLSRIGCLLCFTASVSVTGLTQGTEMR